MMRPFDVTVVPSVDLGEAAEYALLALGGANLAVTSASVQGNVGAGPRTVQQLRDIAVSRSLFTDPTARVDRSQGVAARGGVNVRPLTVATDAARAASARAAAPPVSTRLRVVNRTTTLGRATRRTVASLTSLELAGTSTLTRRGGPTDEFVLNVSGNVKLSGSAAIVLDGVLAANVLVNVPGTGREVKVADAARAVGTILNPYGSLRMAGGTLTGAALVGAAFVGGEVNISGGARIARC